MFPQPSSFRFVEALAAVVAMAAGVVIVVALAAEPPHLPTLVVAGIVFTGSLIVLLRLWLDPDRIRARQNNAMLTLASRMLATIGAGLDSASAQAICEMLLPATSAIAVAITDRVNIMGYAGEGAEYNPLGSPIRTVATRATVRDGQMRVLHSSGAIGFPEDHPTINAAILVPLTVSGETVGTLKFYFPRPRSINATQQSIAEGFGELISTQLAAYELEEQRKLATSMELKALQSQINPHFLFNTINTIASFVRTDPDKARTMLRDFAAFYRSTLEDSSDLIALRREVQQTQRYFGFEVARFGEERLELVCDVPDELAETLVPAFVVQPLVENAVRHGMRAEGKLHIRVAARMEGAALVLTIVDDGVGMSEERRAKIMESASSTGLGIAVRNINDRIRGYYGPGSHMAVESAEDRGTTVTLHLCL